MKELIQATIEKTINAIAEKANGGVIISNDEYGILFNELRRIELAERELYDRQNSADKMSYFSDAMSGIFSAFSNSSQPD